ncbi:MAG: acylneuraminate cytidylyltransferase family protein [Candidatus Paceibacterota bacterium]
MINNNIVIAIIPARGGSKRIPRKNIKELDGKPLLTHTISAAKNSQYIDRIIVSTDDKEIAQIALEHGAEVPFMRPTELAEDHVTDFPLFEHLLQWLFNNENYKPNIIVQLRPTSPLRETQHIDDAIELLVKNPDADSVRTVIEPEQSPYKMYSVNEGGFLKPLLKIDGETESFNLPQQKLPKTYKHVGYVDVMWHKTIAEKKQMTGDKIIPLILNEAYSGINSMKDWEYYEYLINRKKNE